MIFRIGIENNNDGRTIAWALEHPGCFAYGQDGQEAQRNFPQAARSYVAWIARHGGSWVEDNGVQIVLEEIFDDYFINNAFDRLEPGKDTTMVEAFFLHDWKPLSATEVERALKLLSWSRAELLDLVKGLTAEKLHQRYPNERWSINGILRHIGAAEWWYQERIGFPYPEMEDHLPADPFEQLALVRDHFNTLLPELEGMNKVIGLEGEIWSPRKMLRRAAWHERDHTEHIRKLV